MAHVLSCEFQEDHQDNVPYACFTFCSSRVHRTISDQELGVIGDALLRQLLPDVQVHLCFQDIWFLDEIAVRQLKVCVRALPNPITTLRLSDTCVSGADLSLLLGSCGSQLKHLTVTLYNNMRGFQELWEHEGCQNLESLCLTTDRKSGESLGRAQTELAFQELNESNFRLLETFELSEFRCDDEAVDSVVDGILRVASPALKHVKYGFFCSSLTENALDSLSRLSEQLPEHIKMGVAFREVWLFDEATDGQVERFLLSLEHRSAPLTQFFLTEAGLKPEHAIRTLKAIESFDLQLPEGGPFEEEDIENPCYEQLVCLSQDLLLDNDKVFDQLVESIPKMTKIPRLWILDDDTRLPSEKMEPLLHALSKNLRLCNFCMASFEPWNLLTSTNEFKNIIRRNIAFGATVPMALATVRSRDAPVGLIPEILKASVIGCGEYSGVPLYPILRDQVGKLWG